MVQDDRGPGSPVPLGDDMDSLVMHREVQSPGATPREAATSPGPYCLN